MKTESPKLVADHLFRSEYGRVLAILTHKYGTVHLEKIEDAVQDTFIKAMRVWGYKKMPDNPTAWLVRVANNHLIDIFRRERKVTLAEDDAFDLKARGISSDAFELNNIISDSQLKMIFACCHPSLSKEYQIILSLKLIGGFGNKEIAEALLKKEETVAKSFTRAKKKLKEQIKTLDIPVELGLQSRLFVVIRVIYLLFSEGYSVTFGTLLIKKDICYEAIRLALLLRQNEYCRHPNVEALIALMCFHAARFKARLGDNQELIDLEHQDRSLYNQELIRIGIFHLENSETVDKKPSHYHLEAAVSYWHCIATSFEETNWKQILNLYDLHLQSLYSPIVALNRIIPYYKLNGAEQAMKELNAFKKRPHFTESALFYAIEAELLIGLGKEIEAVCVLKKAIAWSTNVMEKRHFIKKAAFLERNTVSKSKF